MSGILYIIPTPIGNFEDITLRALKMLETVDLILAEDTRNSGKLLKHYKIKTPQRAFHSHNEHAALEPLLQELQSGRDLALISDAGTPGISDPGFLLVRACREAGLPVEVLPGPSAFVTALVASGLPCDRFHFEGFLPHKKGRRGRLAELAELPTTFVLYESPYRILKCLQQLMEYCGPDRPAAVARELTKLHEEVLTGSLQELAAHFEEHKPRGEFVLIVGAKGK